MIIHIITYYKILEKLGETRLLFVFEKRWRGLNE